MMPKNPLARSQNAHKRLADKHSKEYRKTNKGIHWIKNGYHNNVANEQEKLQRKLTSEEKTKIFKRSENYYYN